MELIYVNTTSFTAKNTFTTEVQINDVAGGGVQASLPPFFFMPGPYGGGKSLRVTARGILSSTGTPTFTFALRMGTAGSITSAIVLGSAAVTTGATVTNQLFEFEGDVVMRTMGAAGANSTVQGLGLVTSSGFAAPYTYPIFAGAASPGTVATVDTSIENYLNFNVACSASSASNSVQLLQLEVFGLN
jgi:hypothetical protein